MAHPRRRRTRRCKVMVRWPLGPIACVGQVIVARLQRGAVRPDRGRDCSEPFPFHPRGGGSPTLLANQTSATYTIVTSLTNLRLCGFNAALRRGGPDQGSAAQCHNHGADGRRLPRAPPPRLPSGPARGRLSGLCVLHSEFFSTAIFYGRAGRFAAQNGGFRPLVPPPVLVHNLLLQKFTSPRFTTLNCFRPSGQCVTCRPTSCRATASTGAREHRLAPRLSVRRHLRARPSAATCAH